MAPKETTPTGKSTPGADRKREIGNTKPRPDPKPTKPSKPDTKKK